MELLPFNKKNRSCKRVAQLKNDALIKEPSVYNSEPFTTDYPAFGLHFKYGDAFIKASPKHKTHDYFGPNPMGWLLPGGRWTDNTLLVVAQAKEINRLIGLCGGIASKKQVVAKSREVAA